MKPTWLDTLEKEKGVREAPGVRNNPRIVEYHHSTNLHRQAADKDSTPWCSSVINWCMEQSGFIGTDSARALSWLSWGCELVKPMQGCVVVLQHKSGPHESTRSGHHVTLFVDRDKDGLWCLGGNQSDRVQQSYYPTAKWRVLGYRWPIQRQS